MILMVIGAVAWIYGRYYDGRNTYAEHLSDFKPMTTDRYSEYVCHLVDVHVTATKYLINGLQDGGMLRDELGDFGEMTRTKSLFLFDRVARHIYLHHGEAAAALKPIVAGIAAIVFSHQTRMRRQHEIEFLKKGMLEFVQDIMGYPHDGCEVCGYCGDCEYCENCDCEECEECEECDSSDGSDAGVPL